MQVKSWRSDMYPSNAGSEKDVRYYDLRLVDLPKDEIRKNEHTGIRVNYRQESRCSVFVFDRNLIFRNSTISTTVWVWDRPTYKNHQYQRYLCYHSDPIAITVLQ